MEATRLLVTALYIFDLLRISGDVRVCIREIIKLSTSIVFWRGNTCPSHYARPLDGLVYFSLCLQPLTNVNEMLGYGMQMSTFIYCQQMQRPWKLLMQV